MEAARGRMCLSFCVDYAAQGTGLNEEPRGGGSYLWPFSSLLSCQGQSRVRVGGNGPSLSKFPRLAIGLPLPWSTKVGFLFTLTILRSASAQTGKVIFVR